MDNNKLSYREYEPLLDRAGLDGEGFTFHALRRTFATALSARGEHPKVVQALLGHSSSRKRWTPTRIS
jgi:integrase